MILNKEKDIVQILRNIPVFQDLSDNDYRDIIPLLKQERYSPESLIMREGDSGDSMCMIISGTVKVTKAGEEEDEIFLEALYAGSYFGEFSLIDNLPRSASITTIEETELFRLEKRSFDVLLANNNRIATTFYKNCLEETFSRFRNIISNFSFSQHVLKEKSSQLEEINKDLNLAKKIQDYFIDTDFLDHEQHTLNGVHHSYIYHPCATIGGDFLNVAPMENGLAGIVIADIMGHGITSALATGVLKSAFALGVKQLGDKPKKLMRFLNKHFHEVISELYATCYYTLLDTVSKRLTFVKAGHHHPLFWKKDTNDFVKITCPGTGLGLIKKPVFEEVEFPYGPGDKILFFTDGILEQPNKNMDMYTEKRLREIFRELCSRDEKDILKHIYNDLISHSEGVPFDDDVTLFLLEF